MLILLTGILYNEIVYLDEWINFHKKQGVDLFYIGIKYKTKQQDNKFQELVKKYQNDKGIVFYHLKQTLYSHVFHFFKHYYERHINDWVAIIDIDEFLYSPLDNKKITDIIEIYEKEKKYAIGINWKCFGSNNMEKNPEYKVLEKFTRCANKHYGINYIVKTLVKINCLDIKNIKKMNIHKYPLKSGYCYYTSNGKNFINHNKNNIENLKVNRTKYLKFIYNKSTNIACNDKYVYADKNPYLILNHYIVRSKEEYQMKIDNNARRKDRYNITTFNRLNSVLNEIEDTCILNKL